MTGAFQAVIHPGCCLSRSGLVLKAFGLHEHFGEERAMGKFPSAPFFGLRRELRCNPMRSQNRAERKGALCFDVAGS